MGAAGNLVGEVVVLVPVLCLIGPDHQHHVAQHRIVGKGPVVLRDLRRGHIGRVPGVDLGKVVRVAHHGLFLEISHHPVRGLWSEEVKEEVEVPLKALNKEEKTDVRPIMIESRIIVTLRKVSPIEDLGIPLRANQIRRETTKNNSHSTY